MTTTTARAPFALIASFGCIHVGTFDAKTVIGARRKFAQLVKDGKATQGAIYGEGVEPVEYLGRA